MARVIVTRDDLDLRIYVEIVYDPLNGACEAHCSEHAGSLVSDSHEQWNFEDAVEVAKIHVDQPHTD